MCSLSLVILRRGVGLAFPSGRILLGLVEVCGGVSGVSRGLVGG